MCLFPLSFETPWPKGRCQCPIVLLPLYFTFGLHTLRPQQSLPVAPLSSRHSDPAPRTSLHLPTGTPTSLLREPYLSPPPPDCPSLLLREAPSPTSHFPCSLHSPQGTSKAKTLNAHLHVKPETSISEFFLRAKLQIPAQIYLQDY